MTVPEAVERLNVVLAHAWMVRTYLKHADEIQEDEEFLEVPRTIFDYVRAVEPAAQRGDFRGVPAAHQGEAVETAAGGGVLRRQPQAHQRPHQLSDGRRVADGVRATDSGDPVGHRCRETSGAR